MKFGEVYDYRNAEEAKQFIGKKGVFCDNLRKIEESPGYCYSVILNAIDREDEEPFALNTKTRYQFFRPILEDELMTNRQLAEWLAKGHGEVTLENYDAAYIYTGKVYPKGDEDKPVTDDTIIRRWNDTEWSKPTRAIYEEDCMPNTAINKEDCK